MWACQAGDEGADLLLWSLRSEARTEHRARTALEPAGKQGLATPCDAKIDYENDIWCMVVHAKLSHNKHEVGDACSTDHIWPTHGRASASEGVIDVASVYIVIC